MGRLLNLVCALVLTVSSFGQSELDSYRAIAEAIKHGDQHTALSLLDKPALSERDMPTDFEPLVILASRMGVLSVVQKLHEKHWDLNVRNARGDTALHKAISYGHVDVIKFLLNSGANPFATNNLDFSVLHSGVLKKQEAAEVLKKQDAAVKAFVSILREKKLDALYKRWQEVQLDVYFFGSDVDPEVIDHVRAKVLGALSHQTKKEN